MTYRVRLLPVLIIVAALLFGVKLGDLGQGASVIVAVSNPAVAQESQGENGKQEDEAAAKDEKSSEGGEEGASEQAEEPGQRAPSGVPEGPRFTDTEVEMLQSLVVRREELDARARALDLQANLFTAAEERIDRKIVELKKIEETIRGLLKKHDEGREKKLRSLVKIYENMKPKNAAVIFDRLDMEIFLNVAERMREAKMAPIVARMDPDKAMNFSTQLHERRSLPETGEANAAGEPAKTGG